MSQKSKKLSSPISTGGGGPHFEAQVQASYVVLMVTGGRAPCLPGCSITKIKLQGKIQGYETDDLILFAEDDSSKEEQKLLGQVKLSIQLTKGNPLFADVIQAAWNDFNNKKLFNKGRDKIALITGHLSKRDYESIDWLLEHSRAINDPEEFFTNVKKAKFSSSTKDEKLEVLRYHLTAANNGTALENKEFHEFLRHFHLLSYDLAKEQGVILSLIHSHISQFNSQEAIFIWYAFCDLVQKKNKHAGTIDLANIPEEILKKFADKPKLEHLPSEFDLSSESEEAVEWKKSSKAPDIALLTLVAAWEETNNADVSALDDFIKKT